MGQDLQAIDQTTRSPVRGEVRIDRREDRIMSAATRGDTERSDVSFRRREDGKQVRFLNQTTRSPVRGGVRIDRREDRLMFEATRGDTGYVEFLEGLKD